MVSFRKRTLESPSTVTTNIPMSPKKLILFENNLLSLVFPSRLSPCVYILNISSVSYNTVPAPPGLEFAFSMTVDRKA